MCERQRAGPRARPRSPSPQPPRVLTRAFAPQNGRIFNGPDGYQYRWRPANNQYNDVVVSVPFRPGCPAAAAGGRACRRVQARSLRPCVVASEPIRCSGRARRADRGHHRLSSPALQLQDQNDVVIAFFRPTRPQRYNIGEVHGELHFVRNAGAGVVVRVPSFPLLLLPPHSSLRLVAFTLFPPSRAPA